MKRFTLFNSALLLLVLALGISEQSVAQDDNRGETVQLFNTAQELAQSNEFDDAIDLYRDVLAMAQQHQFDDIIEMVSQRLPIVAINKASAAFRAYQSQQGVSTASEAIESFQNANEIAREFGNNDLVQQTSGAIPQLYYARSIHLFRQQNYSDALTDLDRAIELNENYAAAYYQKGLVLKQLNPADIDGFLAWYDRSIEIAQRVNDTRTLTSARNGARDELIYRAVNFADERRFNAAVELLNRIEQYDSQFYETHYRLAEISNIRGNWSTAETHARRALDLHRGGVANKAKIYFELGTALKGQGKIEGACSAFENARYGGFTDPANHELQFELKCEGHTASGRR